MSKFKSFLSRAVANSNNVSDVQLVAPTKDLNQALGVISSFINGAVSDIELNSFIFVGGNAIAMSGRKDSESLHIHSGFVYFNGDAADIEDVNAQNLNYTLPYTTSQSVVNIQTLQEALGFYLTITATDLTDGNIQMLSTSDGVQAERNFSVRTGESVSVFIPSRSHAVDENKAYTVTGTGTALDPYILNSQSDLLANPSTGVMTPAPFNGIDQSLVVTYQNVYISVELIPNRFSYLKTLFS